MSLPLWTLLCRSQFNNYVMNVPPPPSLLSRTLTEKRCCFSPEERNRKRKSSGHRAEGSGGGSIQYFSSRPWKNHKKNIYPSSLSPPHSLRQRASIGSGRSNYPFDPVFRGKGICFRRREKHLNERRENACMTFTKG